METEHKEPEKPLVYEPPDLEGRDHVAKGKCVIAIKRNL